MLTEAFRFLTCIQQYALIIAFARSLAPERAVLAGLTLLFLSS